MGIDVTSVPRPRVDLVSTSLRPSVDLAKVEGVEGITQTTESHYLVFNYISVNFCVLHNKSDWAEKEVLEESGNSSRLF